MARLFLQPFMQKHGGNINMVSYLLSCENRVSNTLSNRQINPKSPVEKISLDWITAYVPILSEVQFKRLTFELQDLFEDEFIYYLDKPRSDGHHTFWHTSESCRGIKLAYSLPYEEGVGRTGLACFTFTGSLLSDYVLPFIIELLALLAGHDAKLTRLDSYCDIQLDFGKILCKKLLPCLPEFNDEGVRNFKGAKVGKAVIGSDEWQLRFGSRASEKFTRIYDKDLESKGETPVIRWELEYKGDSCREFAENLLALETPEQRELYIRDCVFGHIDFIDRAQDTTGQHVNRCDRLPFWQDFLEMVVCVPVSVQVSRPQTSFKKKVAWIKRQCATTLSQLCDAWGEDSFLGFCQQLAEIGNLKQTAKHRAEVRVYVAQQLSHCSTG